jgi:tRNA(adenine34) deaminase
MVIDADSTSSANDPAEVRKDDVPTTVPELSSPEWLCLDLAWQAYGAGSVPVGAVVLDADGGIVATGRSRMYEQSAPPPELANSLLAHAEINALVGLDPFLRYEDFTLITALEPCPLCLGAVAMSTIGKLVYLGADPYGGAIGLLGETPHTARVPVQIDGPRIDSVGMLVSSLHVAFYLRRNPGGAVVRVHREQRPDIVDAAERLLAVDADEHARTGVAFKHIAPTLLAALQR